MAVTEKIEITEQSRDSLELLGELQVGEAVMLTDNLDQSYKYIGTRNSASGGARMSFARKVDVPEKTYIIVRHIPKSNIEITASRFHVINPINQGATYTYRDASDRHERESYVQLEKQLMGVAQ